MTIRDKEHLFYWREFRCALAAVECLVKLEGTSSGSRGSGSIGQEQRRQLDSAAASSTCTSFLCPLRRRQFPSGEVPGKPRHGSDPCPACGYQLSSPEQTFCVTCGHYDANLRSAGGGSRTGGGDAAAA